MLRVFGPRDGKTKPQKSAVFGIVRKTEMGTNYYIQRGICEHCGRGDQDLHIGKSSGGWVFALNTHPELGIESLDDWRREWSRGTIINEYGDTLTAEEMERVIANRQPVRPRDWSAVPFGYHSMEDFLAHNHALPDPTGLLRHMVDGRHCIAHGDGTYDLMRGEFS